MKKSSHSFLKLALAAMTAFTFFFTSCEIGMGQSVDLEAPVISVQKMVSGGETPKTSFETSIYCRQEVSFYGTAEDNIKVTNVRAEMKWAGEESYSTLENARLNGNEWEFDIAFPREGACYLKFTAEDRSGNYGIKSSKVITLFIDNSAPVGDAWYIDRLHNGIQYNLQSLDALKNIVEEDSGLNEPSNKDVAQNVKFDIRSAFSDISGVQNVSISIWDEDGNKIINEIPKSSTSTNYAPAFTVTHDMLKAAKASLDSGLHFLQVRYTAEDTVTDPAPNKVEDKTMSLGWFIWWPESDNPKYAISDLKYENGNPYLRLHIGDSLSVTLFDDDALKGTVSCELVDTNGNSLSPEIKKEAAVNTNESEKVLVLQAPTTPQTLKLKIYAEAISGEPINNITIPVTVSDDSLPTLILTKPENNQIPSVTGTNADISFEGITLDKSDCKYLEFVWVPQALNAADKKAKAQAWLNSLTVTNHANYASGFTNGKKEVAGTGDYAGMKLWSVELTPDGSDSGFKKTKFDFDLELLNDFVSVAANGTSTNEKALGKYFLIRLIRADEKYSDSELTLSSDDLKPIITLQKPSGNMAIIDQEKDLEIKFKAEKTSKLPIAECRLFDVSAVANLSALIDEEIKTEAEILAALDSCKITGNLLNGVFKADSIEADTLAGYAGASKNPKFVIYAKDVLGNYKFETYEFILSSLPTINTITSSAPTKIGLYDESGKPQKIQFNVSFTKTITLDTATPKLKLKGIKNGSSPASTIRYAEWLNKEGNGTTTLTFTYTVQPGDETETLNGYNGIQVDSDPIVGIDATIANITGQLKAGCNLQEKRASNPITIDAILPEVESISVTSAVDSDNVASGIKYLREGRTITANVVTSKPVTVQGSPSMKVKVGSSDITLAWQSASTSAGKTTLIFSKKVTGGTSGDPNGAITYDEDTCLDGIDVIKDSYNNKLTNPLTGTDKDPKLFIDTKAPEKKPEISGITAGGKYINSVSFTVTNPNTVTATTDSPETVQYSIDGGKTWTSAEGETLNSSTSVYARIKDKAGNVSAYAGPVNVEINSTFPSFTVECTNADGNYKAGTDLKFNVHFASPVVIASDSSAFILLSGKNDTDHTDASTKAELDADCKGKTVSTATFTYQTRDPDEFTLKIAANAIDLDGIVDEYGIGQGQTALAEDYVRDYLRCDGVAPKVISMTPQGTATTLSDGRKKYTNGKKIVLTFDEPVKVVSGKIYLRQIAGWAIPPVIDGPDFNTILNSIPSATIDTAKTGGLTATKVLYMDGMEDSEWMNGSAVGPANDIYHGTGQYVGPYKKSTQGIDGNGNPDVSTKYVLDFDVDIWNSSDSTKTKFGKTFTSTKNDHNDSRTDLVSVKDGDTTITTDNLRYVLEAVHYHERYCDVTSSNVVLSNGNRTVTITFPEGLLGDDALPLGREWELVIEKGCFMDETGNSFGAEANGIIRPADAVQETTGTGKQYTLYIGDKEEGGYDKFTGSWGRGRTSVTNNDKVSPLVLIENGEKESFWSAGAAKPWVRVDRYSYGLGMKQPGGTDSNIIQTAIEGNNPQPTGYVRVRVDCESRGATVKYNKAANTGTGSVTTDSAANTYEDKDLIDNAIPNCKSYYTSTTVTINESPDFTSATQKAIFLGGNDFTATDNKTSMKQYIVAKAEVNSDTSAIEKEGIFRTVLHVIRPLNGRWSNADTAAINNNPVGYRDLSIRGTTGFAGEPSISPFPLRDSQVGSPFLKRAYNIEDNNYYWVSFEILVNTSFSGYLSNNSKDRNGNNTSTYDWSRSWGVLEPGEFTRCTYMRRW